MHERVQKRLEKHIDALKTFLSKYRTIEVLGAIATELIFKKEGLIGGTGLSSPHKQLLYLAGLLPSTEQKDCQPFEKNSLEKAKKYLEKTSFCYAEMFFPTEQEFREGLSEYWKKTRAISMAVFLNYFNTTPLCFQEQAIDRVRDWFLPFDEFIKVQTGLTVERMIDIFLYIQKYLENQLNTISELKKEYEKQHREFFDSLGQNANLSIEELREQAQKHPIKNSLEILMEELTLVYQISIDELENHYRMLERVYFLVRRAWRRWLGRRHRSGYISVEKFKSIIEATFPLPRPRIVHNI